LQAIAIAGVEVDSSACVACVHRVRTGSQSANRHSLCFARRRLQDLIFREWDFSFAQSMNQLATSSSFSGGWVFFPFEQSMRRLAMSCLIFLSRMGIFFFCTIDEARS
jgi:hypothetical protein